METVKNRAKKPLRIPLPRGKFLHLGLGLVGQITDEARNHAPVKALIDAGELEVLGHDHPEYQGAGPQGATQNKSQLLGGRSGRR